MHRLRHAALAVLFFAATASADVLTQTDGSHLTGKIIAEDAASVTLQTNIDELVIQRKIAKKDLTRIDRAAKPDATYCKIPIEGEIGVTVKAAWVSSALDQARLLKADYVILCFDSPGGKIDEMIKILDVLKNVKDLKLVAHVKNAGSAAAILALACPTIIITPNGSIGAAVPFKLGPDGTPQDIEAKFFSYFDSIARSAADAGGHSPLLARGMMELNLTLSRITKNNKTEIVEGAPPNSTLIKKAGEILTLQGKEALAAGLANALSDDPSDNAATVGIKTWASVGDSAWSFMKARQSAQVDAHNQIETLRTQANAITTRANRAADEANRLAAQYKQEAAAVTNQPAHASTTPATKPAADPRNAQLTALQSKYQPLLDEQKQIYDTSAASLATLNAQIQKLQSEMDSR